MLDEYSKKPSWDAFIDTKEESKVRFGQIILKLVFLFVLLIAYSLLRKFSVFDAVRIRGINPSHTCITDSSHAALSNMLLALQAYPAIRACLQILSSLMIDSVFVYLSISW